MVLLTIKIDSVYGWNITEKMQGISKNEIACRSGYFVFQNAPWDFMLCKSTSKYTKNVG
jgi:hypothetical protein